MPSVLDPKAIIVPTAPKGMKRAISSSSHSVCTPSFRSDLGIANSSIRPFPQENTNSPAAINLPAWQPGNQLGQSFIATNTCDVATSLRGMAAPPSQQSGSHPRIENRSRKKQPRAAFPLPSARRFRQNGASRAVAIARCVGRRVVIRSVSDTAAWNSAIVPLPHVGRRPRLQRPPSVRLRPRARILWQSS